MRNVRRQRPAFPARDRMIRLVGAVCPGNLGCYVSGMLVPSLYYSLSVFLGALIIKQGDGSKVHYKSSQVSSLAQPLGAAIGAFSGLLDSFLLFTVYGIASLCCQSQTAMVLRNTSILAAVSFSFMPMLAAAMIGRAELGPMAVGSGLVGGLILSAAVIMVLSVCCAMMSFCMTVEDPSMREQTQVVIFRRRTRGANFSSSLSDLSIEQDDSGREIKKPLFIERTVYNGPSLDRI